MNYLIKEQEGLRLFKYKNKVFYKNLWDDELVEYRGLVKDYEDNVVQRPFTKIFNWSEGGRKETDLEQWVCVSEKINGFMAAATIHKGKLLVSTTGSLNSEFQKLAYSHLEKLNFELLSLQDYTFIFEIVDAADPHIIKEEVGVYLLGVREKKMHCANHGLMEGTLDTVATIIGCKRPKWFFTTIEEVLAKAKTCTREGFVFWNSECEYKIKSPFYLITKFLGRTNKEYKREYIDEEFYPLIEAIKAQNNFRDWPEQDKIKFIRGFLGA